MKKRAFALFLGLALCFGLAGTAFAAEMVEVNGEWILVDDDWEPPASPSPSQRPSNNDYTPRDSSYSVTAPASTTGGKVTLSTTSAKKGATVTVTVTPDKGYKLDKLSVTDSKGNAIQTRDHGDGKYTFTMPDGKVDVNATFVAIPQITFVDVDPGAYYADAVAWAVEKGITNGTGVDTFSPNQTCTRGQIVTFLWRAMGNPKAASSSSFTDVAPGAYYADAVAWAVANGITNGTGDGKFSPNEPCTRSQAVTFLHRAEGLPAAGGGSFSDVEGGSWHADAVAWAVANGITNGTGNGRFSPNDTCTRGQIVTFLYRDMA